MVGIISYGAYVPFNRMKRDCFKVAFQTGGKGEKAVANYDEDSLTMAVASSLEAMKNFDSKKLNSVSISTTTSPYVEKSCATTLALAIDANSNVRTSDFSNSLRCGTTAMLSAIDSAKAGLNTLVSISDCRLGAGNGVLETTLGDGAAAFIFGSENVIAKYIDSATNALEITDYWRSTGQKFVQSWEERFGINEGYKKVVPQTIVELFKKTNTSPSDYSKIVLYAANARYQVEVARKLGFTPEQIEDSLYETVGNAGCANAPMMLAAALETAKPGDKIMVVTYGNGCDAISFEVTEEINNLEYRPGIQKYLENKKNTMNYEKYLLWKGLMEFEPARRPKMTRSSQPYYFRERMKNVALYGSKCTECETPQFPPTRVCSKCGAIDHMEDYPFYGRKGKIFTYTTDKLSSIPDAPEITAVIDFEDGGRMVCNLVDADWQTLEVGMEVEMSFRHLFEADGIHTYHWKAILKNQ